MKKIFAVLLLALSFFALFAAPAFARGGGGGHASVSVHVSVAPRAVVAVRPAHIAPRAVYVAPRPVIIGRPAVIVSRPIIVARPAYVAPVIVPTVAPGVDVLSSYGQPAPVGVVYHEDHTFFLIICLVILLVILGGGYGFYYFDPFDVWVVDTLIIDSVYDY